MNSPADLKLLSMDPETGETVTVDRDPLKAENAELRAEVERLKAEVLMGVRTISGLRRQITRMTAARIDKAKASPMAERAWRLIDAWQKLCNHMRCAQDDGRFETVMNALQRREKAGLDMDEAEGQLRKALFGAQARPYLVGYEHKPEGKPDQRKDLIEYVLSDEKRIAKFSGFAQAEAERILDAMVKPLALVYGRDVLAIHDSWSNEITEWSSPCPVCEEGTPTLELAIVFSAELEMVRLRCFTGCGSKAIRGRLREMYGELKAVA